jgi:hypothetical protein
MTTIIQVVSFVWKNATDRQTVILILNVVGRCFTNTVPAFWDLFLKLQDDYTKWKESLAIPG